MQRKSRGKFLVYLIMCIAVFLTWNLVDLRIRTWEAFTVKHKLLFHGRFAARNGILSLFNPVFQSTALYSRQVPSQTLPSMSAASPLMHLTTMYNKREIIFRTAKRLAENEATALRMAQIYSKFALDFTATESEAIEYYIKVIPQLAEYDWIFCKLDDSLDYGRPWVLSGCIVLPQHICSEIVAAYKAELSTSSTEDDVASSPASGLLIKLQIYKDAQTHPEKYDEFAKTNLGFVRCTGLIKPASLASILYTDPNCLDDRWIYPKEDVYYYLCLIVSETGDLETRAYKANRESDDKYVVSELWQPGTDFAEDFNTQDCHHPYAILSNSPFILLTPDP